MAGRGIELDPAAMDAHGEPIEVMTDRAPASRDAINELMPAIAAADGPRV